MEVRICKDCGSKFYDKKNDGAWLLAAVLTLGWAVVAELSDKEYCCDCVKSC